ncbi:hypothetical protein K402DRAFT_456882 [Aulographum hederae CBS 113979]|uniref:MutL C-terminal dimerisation domain-containing protein n=1 Tax=Aulographum hederae CBS 113979 TaxID=1176131 RepID=A0A6G1GQ37_9PEZI|nr:hypothetical protein K402DRAFT_456882 [Aulographum hederae CBS 113979]
MELKSARSMATPEHSSPNRPPAQIQQLPAEVIAQIKSSTIITSLGEVIVNLVKNSLDAGASKIEVQVDYRRGGCIVEDDGLGVPPSEFKEEGGLGKLYHTSKYRALATAHGRNGTFLASLSALSLLTIISCHHAYRSHNSVSFHKSTVISRQCPAPNHQHVHSRDHGTRVIVRDLFGNMPVRVKHRVALSDDRAESERLWQSLREELCGLLIAWTEPVSLKVSDVENSRTIAVNHYAGRSASSSNSSRGMNRHERVLHSMSQCGLVGQYLLRAWIPVSASSKSTQVRGAISLDPAPSKRIQFISFGIHPLVSRGHNELYDHINQLFQSSSFGTVEDESEIDETEKERRKRDRRFKSDGYTNRQLSGGRKGIDKWPMFYLNISLGKDSDKVLPERYLEHQSTLHEICAVVEAMVTQWLSAHHFRTRKRRNRTTSTDRPVSASPPAQSDDPPRSISKRGNSPESSLAAAGLVGRATRREANNSDRKRKRSGHDSLGDPIRPYTGITSFNELSRIKSGKPEYYENLWAAKRIPKVIESGTQAERADANTPNFSKFAATPIEPGELGQRLTLSRTESCLDARTDDHVRRLTDHGEEIVEWKDPISHETFLINARTGATLPAAAYEKEEVAKSKLNTARIPSHERLTQKRVQDAPSQKQTGREWVEGFLKEWDNPVFRQSEASIPRTSFDLPTPGTSNGRHGCCNKRLEMEKAFQEASISTKTKLSKEALSRAQVIAQVDKKFILVRIDTKKQGDGEIHDKNEKETDQTLVLIDQHAADERCKLEELMTELCAAPTKDSPTYRSSLGFTPGVKSSLLPKPASFEVSAEEGRLLELHAAHFANWGIVYDVAGGGGTNARDSSNTKSAVTSAKARHVVQVLTLSVVIAERAKTEPKLLISLIRAEVWKLAESSTTKTARPSRDGERDDSGVITPPTTHADNTAEELSAETKSDSWLNRTASCPQGILDMLNSRACRSAIMFNDTLTTDECTRLVKKLAGCAFPFQCAHGRPSMVPLIGLGHGGAGFANSSISNTAPPPPGLLPAYSGRDAAVEKESGFAASYRRWRGEMEGDRRDVDGGC